MKVEASRLLFLLSLQSAVTQAFQLDPNNHLVSLTHQPTTQNPPLPLPLPKRKPTNSFSPQTAAPQINRTVNRNTKNRQNQSKCSFDAPHSTLLDIATAQHHGNNILNINEKDKHNENVRRSLRQLGITIASTLLFVSQVRVGVANAAAAYTPLIVTHPNGVGSTAVTPLLSTLPYQGIAIVPSMKGISPAVGEIIMSFAYVIIALGVSHGLMSASDGGYRKLMKLMAWQNLADGDDKPVLSSSGHKKGKGIFQRLFRSYGSAVISSNKRGEGFVQGWFSSYSYMIHLIVSEIRKAYASGQKLVPVTTPMATSTPSNMMLSRYAFNLNRSFQEIFKGEGRSTVQDEEKKNTWAEYSNLLQKKKRKKRQSRRSFGRVGKVYNEFTMMFERVDKSDSEAEATKKATDLFKQKQYEQHHHHVHVPRSPVEESSYLNSLTKFAAGEDEAHRHADVVTKGYLDTLSEKSKKSTWDVYKGQVEEAKKGMEHEDVQHLKDELAHIQSLLQDEQSMYQTSNQALNLVVEAQNEELKHARAATTKLQQHSTADELKEFDIKAKEYDEAMKESKQVEKSGSESTSPQEWIF